MWILQEKGLLTDIEEFMSEELFKNSRIKAGEVEEMKKYLTILFFLWTTLCQIGRAHV